MTLRSLRSLAVAALFAASPLSAQSPIQVSLFAPVQIVSEAKSVEGLRFSFLYGKNANVSFVDLGWIYNQTTGNGVGFAATPIHQVRGSFSGWQTGAISLTGGAFTGLQNGWLVNNAGSGKGVQWGFINHAGSWHGLQVGAVNVAGNMNGGGLQIGLINVIKQGGQFPVFPIVNFTF